MHLPGKNCDELLKQTAEALDGEALKLLCISVQRNNLNLCIEYAVNE
jgi:hypothetical protein